MNLLILGINHNSAPVEIRERVAFAPEIVGSALREIREDLAVEGAAILSTCNRTELYLAGQGIDQDAVTAWLARYHGQPVELISENSYCHQQDLAVRHMMVVAAGLDSLVLGEPQILGQMKSCYALAKETGTLGSSLERLFQQVFSVAKQVRTDTAIGENPVSVAYAAVSLTQHIFTRLADCNALLIGAGETIELVARHLAEKGIKKIIIANRTLSRASELAANFQAEAIMLADIPKHLATTDIVVASTASQLPILGKGMVEAVLKKRRHRPMLMVDIAVPRDIEPQVGDLSDVYLYTIDDLKEIVADNRRARESEARKADEIVESGVCGWLKLERSLEAVDTVKDFRQQAEELSRVETDKALKALLAGTDPAKVVEQLARGLTNKLIHQPSSQLREAAARGELETLRIGRQLLGLDKEESEKQ